MAAPRTSTKRVRNRRGIGRGIEPEGEGRPESIDQIIKNGLVMLMPFIVERIVASATSPERHAPAPRVPGYFEGYQHAIDEAQYVVRTQCLDCRCALCCKIMSDDKRGPVVQ
jgi:hypothetical protein